MSCSWCGRLILVAALSVLASGCGDGDLGSVDVSSPASDPSSGNGATSPSGDVSDGQGSLAGDPEALGVASIDFITAIMPTSPEEYRVSAAWHALYANVSIMLGEKCMEEEGFVYSGPRYVASELRRNGDMPDFELDALRGTDDRPYQEPKRPEFSSLGEKEAWEARLLECQLEIEERKSKGFDQVIGRIPFWWDYVREANDSPEMAGVTESLLSCVAEAGGPDVESVANIYFAIDHILMDMSANGIPILDTDEVDMPIFKIIADCAGDYNETRQALLVPIRDRIVEEYAEELAEAEEYFNEMLRLAYED